jgi:hypothetical protein
LEGAIKALFATAAFTLMFAAAALAQEGAPPPVDSMNCEQMQAELMVAGQRMSAQLDPEFATEAQAMHEESQEAHDRARGGMAAGVGMGVACSIPGVGMACMATQQAQAAQAQRDAAANQARMDAQMGRLNQSMAGLDQQRLMALSQRFEQQRCQAPQ